MLSAKKVEGALIYPAIVVSAAVILGGGISIFILPKILDVFTGFDVDLPLSTRILISLSQFMQQYGLVVGAVVLVSLFLLATLGRLPSVKKVTDHFTLRIPIFGSLIQKAALAEFCRNIATMLKSGLPITQALQIEAEMAEQAVFAEYAQSLSQALIQGHELNKELQAHHYPFMPLLAVRMIEVGDKTGELDNSFQYLAEFFEEEVDEITKNLSTIIEPILLIGMGLLVAFIALSIISPIYQLTGSIE